MTRRLRQLSRLFSVISGPKKLTAWPIFRPWPRYVFFWKAFSRSRDQQHASDCLAAFDIFMRGGRVLQRESLVDLYFQLARSRDRKSTRLNSSHYCASRM